MLRRTIQRRRHRRRGRHMHRHAPVAAQRTRIRPITRLVLDIRRHRATPHQQRVLHHNDLHAHHRARSVRHPHDKRTAVHRDGTARRRQRRPSAGACHVTSAPSSSAWLVAFPPLPYVDLGRHTRRPRAARGSGSVPLAYPPACSHMAGAAPPAPPTPTGA